MRKKILCTLVCGFLMAMCFAACAPSGDKSEAKAEGSTEERNAVSVQGVTTKDFSSMQDVYDGMDAIADEYAPKITTLEDGTQIQLTPSVYGSYWHMGSQSNSYNTYYLNGDNRGCVSCHTSGLADLVENKLTYSHVELSNNMGTDATVSECKICHNVGDGYVPRLQEFGSMIHGIHSKDTFTGDCMSCHTATANGAGMLLWDEAKYDVFQGMVFPENATGDFSYDQDTTNDMFVENWVSGETNESNIDAAMQGKELDPAVFDNWEINVTGEVDNPFSITLKELIAEAPSEKVISSEQCVMNAPGGELVSNVEVTGIPISWILEKAGVKAGATALMSTAPDGWSRGNLLEYIEERPGYLIYEINGERLNWDQGYPVTTWYPGRAVPACIRWVSELEVVNTPADEVKMFDGWKLEDGTYYNKPNAGILHFREGQIIKAGEPYEFEGYAQAFDQQVVKVEFSLDRGETWTSFDTSDSDLTKWVYWHFTYTPEEVGAYVLSVRAVTAEGLVSVYPDEVMFNAK